MSLIVLGIMLLLRYFDLITAGEEEIFGFVLTAYGIISVYILSGSGKKGRLFITGILFILGVLLIVLGNFEILSPVKLLLSTVLFALGTAFALLFVDNFRETVFLVVSLILLGAGIFTAIYFKLFSTIQAANKIALVIFQYWPVIFILIGFSIILNRNKV
jgi:hypothetical protein